MDVCYKLGLQLMQIIFNLVSFLIYLASYLFVNRQFRQNVEQVKFLLLVIIVEIIQFLVTINAIIILKTKLRFQKTKLERYGVLSNSIR